MRGMEPEITVLSIALGLFSGLPRRRGIFTMRNVFAAVFFCLLCVLAAAADPCPGTVILQNQFAAPNPNWSTAADTTSKPALQNGQYVVTFLTQNTTRSVLYQGDVYGDINLCVTLSTPATDKAIDQVAGLVFWATDYTSYYLLLINPIAGQWEVLHLAGGRYLSPSPYQPSTAIKTGVGAANALQVQMRGTTATIIINGTTVGTVSGVAPTGGGQVGLYCQSASTATSTWQISDWSLSKP